MGPSTHLFAEWQYPRVDCRLTAGKSKHYFDLKLDLLLYSCIVATLSSNMDLNLWATSKHYLKGDWPKVEPIPIQHYCEILTFYRFLNLRHTSWILWRLQTKINSQLPWFCKRRWFVSDYTLKKGKEFLPSAFRH